MSKTVMKIIMFPEVDHKANKGELELLKSLIFYVLKIISTLPTGCWRDYTYSSSFIKRHIP